MVVGFGRVSLWVGTSSWITLNSLLVGGTVSDSGMISGAVRWPSRTCFLSCLAVLPIGMPPLTRLWTEPHPLLVFGTFLLLEILMTGSCLWLLHSSNFCTPFSRDMIGWIPRFGSIGSLVSLMLAPSVLLFKGLIGCSFLGKAFGVLKLLGVFPFLFG